MATAVDPQAVAASETPRSVQEQLEALLTREEGGDVEASPAASIPPTRAEPEPEISDEEVAAATQDETEPAKEEEPAAQEEPGEIETLAQLAEALEMPHDDFLKMNVQVGEDSIPLADVIQGYAKGPEAGRISDEASQARARYEQGFEAQQQAFAQTADQMQRQIETLAVTLTQREKAIDWNALREQDPSQYLIQKQELDEQKQEVGVAVDQLRVHREQAQAQINQAQQQFASSEYTNLLVKKPTWRDETTSKTAQKQIADYLISMDFAPEELDGLVDHRVILVAHEASEYRRLVAKAGKTRTAIKSARRTLSPAARVTRDSAQVERFKKASARLRKSGDDRDAAAVIEEMI